jgi:hypothetical protein
MTPIDDTKQTTAHTPEPWAEEYLPYLSSAGTDIPCYRIHSADASDENYICETNEHLDDAVQYAIARRICAAVNACKGMSTESLEQGVVAELLINLKTLLEQIDEDVPTDITTRHFANAYDEALTTLAKATGRAA